MSDELFSVKPIHLSLLTPILPLASELLSCALACHPLTLFGYLPLTLLRCIYAFFLSGRSSSSFVADSPSRQSCGQRKGGSLTEHAPLYRVS